VSSMTFSPAADELKSLRTSIGLSQSGLARLSGVQRWKINACELGDALLTDVEVRRIRAALQGELDRLRNLPSLSLCETDSSQATNKGSGVAM
jgi:predicted transcriptional regulator